MSIKSTIETRLANSPSLDISDTTRTHAELWLEIVATGDSEKHTYTVVTVNTDGTDAGVIGSIGNKIPNLPAAYDRFKHVGGIILDLHNAHINPAGDVHPEFSTTVEDLQAAN